MRYLKFLILYTLFIFTGSSLQAQEIINSSLDKDKVFIGDIIKFTVKMRLPKNAQISVSQNFNFNDFDIISSNIKHISASENIYELTFNIAAYKLGSLTVNPLTIFYIDSNGSANSFLTPETNVEVISIMENETVQNIKDIKSLKTLKIKAVYVCLIILTFILLFISIVSVTRIIIIPKKKQEQIEIDIKMQALKILNDLYENRNNTSTRIFYYKMSEILRTYVSKQHNFDAMEMTTSEFFDKIKIFFPKEININEFKHYLKIFNLTKYADFMPNEIETENNYNFTKKLLELL
ncbi:MAG: hypothetical protein LBT07_01430 [Endomicrobium sp.]|jgi:hypothetical protein|nr:hypothetical protein [Endomicrobium sp.]